MRDTPRRSRSDGGMMPFFRAALPRLFGLKSLGHYTAAAAAAWLSLYPWAEAQADDAPSYTEIDQYHGEFTAKDGTTFSYLPDAGKFEGPGDKPVTPTGTDAPHNYLIELNGTHLTATGTDNSGLSPSELRILNSDEGTVSTNKLTYYTGSSAYASAGAAGGGSITFVRSRLEADNNIFDFTGTELSASGSAQSVPDGHEPIFSSLTFTDSLQGASDSNTVTMNNGSTQNSSVTLTGGASAVFVSGAAGAASNTITLNGTALSAEGASKDGRVYGDITLISSSGGSVSGSTVTMENRSSQASSVTLTGGASAVFVSGAAGAASNTITLNGTTLSAEGVSEGGCVYGGITLVRSSEGSVSGSMLTVNTATLKATGGTAIDFVSSASDAVSNTITLNETNLSAEGVSEDGNVYGGISLVSSADGSVSGSTLELTLPTDKSGGFLVRRPPHPGLGVLHDLPSVSFRVPHGLFYHWLPWLCSPRLAAGYSARYGRGRDALRTAGVHSRTPRFFTSVF